MRMAPAPDFPFVELLLGHSRKRESNCSAMKKGVHRCQEHPDRTFRGRPPGTLFLDEIARSVSFLPSQGPPRHRKRNRTESRRDERNQGGREDHRRRQPRSSGNDQTGRVQRGSLSSSGPSAYKHPSSHDREEGIVKLANHFLIALEKYKLANQACPNRAKLKSQAILGPATPVN